MHRRKRSPGVQEAGFFSVFPVWPFCLLAVVCGCCGEMQDKGLGLIRQQSGVVRSSRGRCGDKAAQKDLVFLHSGAAAINLLLFVLW